MSTSSRSDGDSSLDVEELLEIGTRCWELRKEKEMLKESQPQSFELIRRLELHVKSLSEARMQDKKHIQKLERELLNCSQEIDYLQDQLSTRNGEVNGLSDHVRSLELKLTDVETLQEQVDQLKEQLKRSHFECLLLIQELESREEELQKSALFIEKLEDSASSMALESQCEIESMKLDIMALEQTCFEAKKNQEESLQEKARMNYLIEELEIQLRDAQQIIESLDKENKELREKIDSSERNAIIFKEWMESENRSQLNVHSILNELESNLTISNDKSCSEVSGECFSKVMPVTDGDLTETIERMSHQIHEYEILVEQLKEELREEKLKAKEESEDLAQEMAELRYQMMGLLEEECKRRACIEQASLQRIAELEAQIQKGCQGSLSIVRHLHQA